MSSRAKPYLWPAILILATLAFSVETYKIRSAWPPQGWPFSGAVPFVTPLISNSRSALITVMASSVVWSAAYVMIVREQLTPRSFSWLVIVGLQAIASVIILFAAIPFNSDQYAYVSHANLVLEGQNPYAPPLRRAVASTQLHEISTVWSIDEGSPDAKQRIVLRSRYGPLWELASAIMLVPFTHALVEEQSRVLRFYAALAALACTWTLWIMLRGHAWRSAAMAAFALNPVVLQQTALGAHNDIYGLLLALLAVLALTRKREVLAAFAGSIDCT